MTKHHFVLALRADLRDEDHFLDDMADELIDAGCDDATFSMRYGVPYAEFHREADTLAEALLSAMAQIEAVDGLSVARVENDELLTASALAERLNRSRQNVQQWVSGSRGAGDFPAPAPWVYGTKLWRWSEVTSWLAEQEQQTEPSSYASGFAEIVNSLLELHNAVGHLSPEERNATSALFKVEFDDLLEVAETDKQPAPLASATALEALRSRSG